MSFKKWRQWQTPARSFRPSEATLSLPLGCTKWNAEIELYFSVPCTSTLVQTQRSSESQPFILLLGIHFESQPVIKANPKCIPNLRGSKGDDDQSRLRGITMAYNI